MTPSRWVSFDCYGTLVDWHTGFGALFTPVTGGQTTAFLRVYHQFERLEEAARPHRLYAEVLVAASLRAAARVGVELSESQARTLPDSWDSLPVFADVEEMLAGLRAMNCRLAVLTNCDDALFARTQRRFREPFDLVVTAECVREYKPAPAHFRHFARTTGVDQANWVHVACSWFHDIAPTRELGIPHVWLDRDHTGETPGRATARIESATGVVAAVTRLLDERIP